MDILLLGGTGAIGAPLAQLLAKKHNVYVTTRTSRKDYDGVHYIVGNAMKSDFFYSIMNRDYDVIVDCMVYNTGELKKRLPIVLKSTGQYFFFSSARCYTGSNAKLKENSPRIVDVCYDPEYLALDEYGIAKGREENLLFSSEKKNWTIIRPYITYNTNRMQLGVYEKEDWLRRVINGQTIVFPKDISSRRTSLTYGPDVAETIAKLIGNEKAYGQAFHIATSESHTWEEILNFYCDALYRKTGRIVKVKFVDNSEGLMTVWNKWQIKYDRLFNREFDNSKIESVIGKCDFKETFVGLDECLDKFLENPQWLGYNTYYEAWSDRQCGERTSFRNIPTLRSKLGYIKYRVLFS